MVSGEKGHVFTNWSKTFSCKPLLFFKPTQVTEIREILAKAKADGKHVKVSGAGNSPSDVACTDEYMISLDDFNKLLHVDTENHTVTIQAGMSLKDLNSCLDKYGLAMQNLCAVDFVSVGGLMATGTHGTGENYGIMSSLVVELEIMTADGEILICSKHKNADVFKAALVSLGAIGVILTVKLQCEPAFRLYESTVSRSLDETLDLLETELKQSDHYKFFYYPHADKCLNVHAARSNRPVANDSSWFWHMFVHFHIYRVLLYLAIFHVREILLIEWLQLSRQITFVPVLLVVINKLFHYLFWRNPQGRCDQSFKIFHFNCLFSQSVTEWCIPRSETANVLRRFRDAIAKSNIYVHFPVEVRFVKKDDIYLSPCYGRDSTFINIISYRPFLRDAPFRQQYWDIYEAICASVGGRPHWAKAHKNTPDYFNKVYPEFRKFLEVRKTLDPSGMFLNEYLERHILGTQSVQI